MNSSNSEETTPEQQLLEENRRLQREKEYFRAVLSHDIKSPLAATIGSIDIIREGCLGDVNQDQLEYLQSAIDGCNEVVVMVNNMVDIERILTGRLKISIQSCNIGEVIQPLADRFKKLIGYENIKLKIKQPPKGAETSTDMVLLKRVLWGLLSNAIKFSPENGEITVTAETLRLTPQIINNIPTDLKRSESLIKLKTLLKLTVSDQGLEIPKEDLKRIFEMDAHPRSEHGRERGEAGLALVFCKMVIEECGGMIWAESSREHGNQFIILLPC